MEGNPLHVPESIVEIFANPEIEDKVIAKVRLIAYKHTSLPYILDDNPLSKDLNKVYASEVWEAEVVEVVNLTNAIGPKMGQRVIVKLRVLYMVGQKTIYSSEPTEEKVQFQDNFKILEDVDTSFWDSRVDGSELTSQLY